MMGLKPAAIARKRKRSGLRLLAAVWIVCLLYTLFQGGKTSIMLFVMISLLGLYLLFGFLGTFVKNRGARSLLTDVKQGPILAGSQVRVRFHIDTPKLMPVPYVIVRELLQRHSGETWAFEESVVPRLRVGGDLVYQTPPLERGSYTFADTELVYEDIFGLLEHKRTVSVTGSFQVLPRTVFIPRWNLFNGGFRLAGPEAVQSLSRRETTQINGVRDYVYGDRLSRIHWNATARTGSWKSKEYEHESMPRTMLVLDCSQLGYAAPEQFELAVSCAASLLEYGERNRIHMGLCTLGSKSALFPAARNHPALSPMLLHLVDLAPGGSDNGRRFLEAKKAEFHSGMLFVYISPDTGDKVFEVLTWAKQRQGVPHHIQIGSGNGETAASAAGGWQRTLLQQGMSGTFIASLEDLPAALGGGKT